MQLFYDLYYMTMIAIFKRDLLIEAEIIVKNKKTVCKYIYMYVYIVSTFQKIV